MTAETRFGASLRVFMAFRDFFCRCKPLIISLEKNF